MAHELYQNANGSYAMAYVGAKGWHGLGQQLQPGADRETWLTAAGMDWEARKVPVMYTTPDGLQTWADRVVIFRSDTGAPLAVMSDGYKEVQPAQILDFFRDSAALAGWELETAGVLKGGSQFWALARTGVGGHLDGDKSQTDMFVLLATSLDGTLATIGTGTAVRVVCSNTMQIALRSTDGKAIKQKHSTTFDAKAMARALGVVDPEETWETFSETMRKLGEVEVSRSQASAIFAEILRPGSMGERRVQNVEAADFSSLLQAPRNLYGAPGIKATDPKKGRAIRGLEALETAYVSAPGAMPGSAYGVLQGVTRFVDHVRGSDSDRLSSAWFGQGATLKARTLDVIEEGEWRKVA